MQGASAAAGAAANARAPAPRAPIRLLRSRTAPPLLGGARWGAQGARGLRMMRHHLPPCPPPRGCTHLILLHQLPEQRRLLAGQRAVVGRRAGLGRHLSWQSRSPSRRCWPGPPLPACDGAGRQDGVHNWRWTTTFTRGGDHELPTAHSTCTHCFAAPIAPAQACGPADSGGQASSRSAGQMRDLRCSPCRCTAGWA